MVVCETMIVESKTGRDSAVAAGHWRLSDCEDDSPSRDWPLATQRLSVLATGDWRLSDCDDVPGDLADSEVSNPALFASEFAVELPDALQDKANSGIIAACGVQHVTK
ncbi:hypothetical protein AK812_SmicGene28467 [Symbiodinium microadriaticum]|uniref:Uncharacterized protein n=1 Tax=Symbiodinium microadriaticum TaxID=2951 RepID=A0A1Q9D4G8_SYMMI|nr:hypothetical protein AK812_SmicGene28467 [Symbiodinium microadriaticum]